MYPGPLFAPHSRTEGVLGGRVTPLSPPALDAWRNEVAPERWIITVMAAIVDAEKESRSLESVRVATRVSIRPEETRPPTKWGG
jgi:hypothetical protein